MMATYIVGFFLAIAILWATRYVYKEVSSGRSACWASGGQCSGCGHDCNHCQGHAQ